MKQKQTLIRGIFLAIAMFVMLGSAHANTVTFNVQDSFVDLAAGNFALNIVGTGFVDSTDGGAVSLTFDSSVLNVVSVSVDSMWEFFDAAGTIDNVGGSITGIEFATFGTPAAAFDIATIIFAPISAGLSSLSLSEYTDGVLGGFGLGGSPQAVSFVDGSVTVTAVPVPAAVWFLGSALGLLGWLRRKG